MIGLIHSCRCVKREIEGEFGGEESRSGDEFRSLISMMFLYISCTSRCDGGGVRRCVNDAGLVRVSRAQGRGSACTNDAKFCLDQAL